MKNHQNISAYEAIHTPEKFFNHYYHVFLRLAQPLIAQIPFFPGEKVLDVGCRNGKVTQLLANLNPDIFFQAITTTTGFLDLIQQDKTLNTLNHVEFEHKPLTDLGFTNAFDKVVSFSCLTWVEDKQPVLSQMYQALKPGGKAYLQLFVDHGRDWFDECIFEIARLPEWQGYFKNFRKKVKHCKPASFLIQADEAGFIIEKGELYKRKVPIINEIYFKNWIMTMSSHLAYLPENKVDAFFTLVVENYLMKHPKDAQGRMYYKDNFFEVILSKL